MSLVHHRHVAPSRHHPALRTVLVLSLVASAALFAACGKKEGGATQVAAKVNKEEISVHQINFVLQRQQGLKPEQAPAASKRILEGLIDQELAVQQAQEQKLDRDPRVVMAIEAAKRDIIARAYADKVAETAAKPTAEEVKAYYADKPGLFAQRKIYTLQEISVEADATQSKDLAAKAASARSADELQTALRTAGIRFAARQITQAPENMPLGVVDQVASLGEGKSLVMPTPSGFNVVFVSAAKPAVVTEEQAKPAIEAFLLNERKRKLVEEGIKALRKDAKVQYMGQFAGGPDAVASAPASPVAPVPVASPHGLDDKSLQKGVSGLN